MSVNPITGLPEEQFAELAVPAVQQTSAMSFRFSGQPRAVHHVPLGESVCMTLYSKLSKADVLVVVFVAPAPNLPNKDKPFVRNAIALRNHTFALLVIEDPTPQLHKAVSKGWYLGGPGFNPLSTIGKIVIKAIQKSGASQIIFAGRAESGFAALQISANFPESCVFVDSPDVIVNDSSPHKEVIAYFESVHPQEDRLELIRRERAKYSVVELYRSMAPDNYVIFQQSLSDSSRVNKHYRALKNLYLIDEAQGQDITDRKFFRLYDTEFLLPSRDAEESFAENLIGAVEEFQEIPKRHGNMPAPHAEVK